MHQKLLQFFLIIQLHSNFYASDKIQGIAFPSMHHFIQSKNYDLNLRLLEKLIIQKKEAPSPEPIRKSLDSCALRMMATQCTSTDKNDFEIKKTPTAQQKYQSFFCAPCKIT